MEDPHASVHYHTWTHFSAVTQLYLGEWQSDQGVDGGGDGVKHVPTLACIACYLCLVIKCWGPSRTWVGNNRYLPSCTCACPLLLPVQVDVDVP
jgi:hypothetical protein